MRILLSALLVAALPCAARADDSVPPFEFKDGDRVVLVGNTLIEREQRYGWWELALTARFPGVKSHKRPQGLWRALAAPHQVKAQRTIGRINERLGGDYTDTGFGPRHDGTHREVA